MKNHKKAHILLILAIALLLGYLYPVWSVRLSEEYPETSVLIENIQNKKALIIVAHDDDICGAGMQLAALKKAGWEIDMLAFYNNHHRPAEIPVRKAELLKFSEKLQMVNASYHDFSMRKGADTLENAYMPVDLSHPETDFYKDSLQQMIREKIAESQPAIIFSLDPQIGGYGHPEHVLVSRLATQEGLSLNKEGKANVQFMFYNVVSDRQELYIKDYPVVKAAQEVYHINDGDIMPTPNYMCKVDDTASKMFALKVWASQHRNIKKFMPYYHWYPHWLYFYFLDKEYYSVVPLASKS